MTPIHNFSNTPPQGAENSANNQSNSLMGAVSFIGNTMQTYRGVISISTIFGAGVGAGEAQSDVLKGAAIGALAGFGVGIIGAAIANYRRSNRP